MTFDTISINHDDTMKSIIKTFIMLVWASTAALTSLPAAAKPLRFIYLQGYLSCSHNNQQPVAAFLQIAAHHPDAAMYYGCFDGGYETHPLDPTEHFYLYTITGNGQWSDALAMPAQTAPLEITAMLRQDVLKTPDDTVDVFIAGHSHGGWMAIRVAYQLGLVAGVDIRELLTIDPVSYDLCASQWFPAYVVARGVGFGGEPDDCHRAPRDIEHLTPSVAKAVQQHWTNIYQTDMAFVSSGPIRSADRNIEYTSRTFFDWATAHRAVFIDQASWKPFYMRLNEVASGIED